VLLSKERKTGLSFKTATTRPALSGFPVQGIPDFIPVFTEKIFLKPVGNKAAGYKHCNSCKNTK